MHLRSVVGVVELMVWHGKDPQDGHWGSPVREQWGLKAHQQMSPALEEKLAFTATLAGSYAAAGQLAPSGGAKWTARSFMGWCNGWGAKPKRKRKRGSSRWRRKASRNEGIRSWRF